VGFADSVSLDEAMERRHGLIVIAVAAAVFLGCVPSPPNLMDDVDAVQAQIARNMLESSDWVTARLNGVAYLEKSPLIYWLIALAYAIFGVYDWVARLPLAFAAVALCYVTARFSAWAFGSKAGLYSGVTLATCIGLWLFTRIQIPDAMLTLTVTVAMWGLLRALEGDRRWAAIGAAAVGTGLLLKGLIAVVLPVGAMVLFLVVTGEWRAWRRLHLASGIAIALLIAAPWHLAAAIANPPVFDLTWRSAPGEYHGFTWFYFLNEHVFRFLNMRHPRDYNTVPRILFWAFHLLWLFPWAGALVGTAKQSFQGRDRESKTRLLAICWIGFLLAFFSFSTTQEYYSMPVYPAFALLIGSALGSGSAMARGGLRVAGAIFLAAAAAIAWILSQVWSLPAPGDISQALTQNPDAYTLSLGHMGDLTLQSFAYLKAPLAIALVAALCGAAALRVRRPAAALAIAMVIFFHAARVALIAFDPYLGSRELAEEFRKQPPGTLIVDNQYYTFSSVFFYGDVDRALLLNGRVNNLEYGSYAPGAPDVFLDDTGFAQRWSSGERYYLVVENPSVPRIQALVGDAALHLVRESGGKSLFVNR
jgi:4-amino-4-deoxy-L-arabinose transferase-like glycosyltransferase